jgi:hypothetical protein
VDDPKNGGIVRGLVAVVLVAVRVVVRMVVVAGLVVAGFVSVGMGMAMRVAVVVTWLFLDIFEPEFRDRVAYHAADLGYTAEDAAEVVLDIGIQREKEDLGG